MQSCSSEQFFTAVAMPLELATTLLEKTANTLRSGKQTVVIKCVVSSPTAPRGKLASSRTKLCGAALLPEPAPTDDLRPLASLAAELSRAFRLLLSSSAGKNTGAGAVAALFDLFSDFTAGADIGEAEEVEGGALALVPCRVSANPPGSNCCLSG